MELNLRHKIALVTGSSRGTGEVIARTLAREGARVVFHSQTYNDSSTGEATVWGDISSAYGCEQVLSQLRERQLQIDILVNNYGTADRHAWADTDTDKWLQMYQINVLSAARMAQGLMADMRERGWGEDWADIEKKIVETDYPNPCGRIAERQEVADLVVYLCSPLAGFINGQNIRIDGGAVCYV
jgi:NAD(P)-dependent dehydrogenase (short-subunit alcohol dehydrogenase family)